MEPQGPENNLEEAFGAIEDMEPLNQEEIVDREFMDDDDDF